MFTIWQACWRQWGAVQELVGGVEYKTQELCENHGWGSFQAAAQQSSASANKSSGMSQVIEALAKALEPHFPLVWSDLGQGVHGNFIGLRGCIPCPCQTQLQPQAIPNVSIDFRNCPALISLGITWSEPRTRKNKERGVHGVEWMATQRAVRRHLQGRVLEDYRDPRAYKYEQGRSKKERTILSRCTRIKANQRSL